MSRAFVKMSLCLASGTIARKVLQGAREAALLFMIALSLLVVKPIGHIAANDVHATMVVPPGAPAAAETDCEHCCTGCLGHGWRAPDQVGSLMGPTLASIDVVYAMAEMSAATFAIPPPRKPPRADLRAADAG